MKIENKNKNKNLLQNVNITQIGVIHSFADVVLGIYVSFLKVAHKLYHKANKKNYLIRTVIGNFIREQIFIAPSAVRHFL